ncbi:MAG: hypothetical protein JSW07_05960, partial [bacterium]
NGGSTNRGVNNCVLYVLPDTWDGDSRSNRDLGQDPVYTGVLTQASDQTLQSLVLSETTRGRYVVMDIIDNHGGTAYVGMRSFYPYGSINKADIESTVEDTVLTGRIHGDFVIAEKLEVPERIVSQDPKDKVQITNFDEGIDGGAGTWISTGTGVVTKSTSTYFSGTGSVLIDTATDATATSAKLTLASSVDLSAHETFRIGVKVEDDKKDAIDDVGGVVLKLDSASGQMVIDFSKYVIKLSEIGRIGNFDMSIKTGNGNDRAGNEITTSGTFDISAVTDITIEVKGKSGQSSEIYFDNLFFFSTELDKGKIVLVWDDLSLTLKDEIMPIHSKYGFVGEIGFVGSVFLSTVSGGWNSDSSWLKQALLNGWRMANHCQSGTGWIDNENTDALNYEWSENREILRQEGLRDNYVMIYPDGRFDSNRLTVTDDHFRCARTTQFDGPRTVQWPPAEPMIMNAVRLSSATSLSDAQAAVDHAEAEGSVQIFYCHYLTTGVAGVLSWNDSDYDSLLSYITTKNVDVTTLSDLYKS